MTKTYIAIVIIITAASLTISGCSDRKQSAAAQTTGGDVSRGEHLLYSYNCGSCHRIPGAAEAKGTVGPPLSGFANRNYIAGSLVNTPGNLVLWIEDPKLVEAETAMPKLGVTTEQAKDIAAYLYTLR